MIFDWDEKNRVFLEKKGNFWQFFDTLLYSKPLPFTRLTFPFEQLKNVFTFLQNKSHN